MGVTYQLGKIIRAVTGKKRARTAAVILAAGMGSRMQSEDGTTKQLMLLHGKPVLAHTLHAFADCPYIDDIVVVTRREEADRVRTLIDDEKIGKMYAVVVGGDTRQESAKNGFDALAPDVGYVAVHDAARCMVTPDMIADVVSEAYETKAASAACRVTDTVKKAGGDGIVLETPDRNMLWFAQTPQVFYADLYRAAVYMADKEHFSATDDNMLVEHIGHRVKLVDCGKDNFKITEKADLIMAEVILRLRESEAAKKDKKKDKKEK